MANNNLYNYLNKNFGKVTVLKNGYYYAVDKHGNEIYMNPNAPTNVNLVVYYPGLGGPKKTVAGGLRDAMSSSNPPNYCTVIAKNWQDPDKVLTKTSNILKANNYKIQSLFTSGNSASGGVVLRRTADYLKQHPELIGSTVIDMNDAYNMEGNYKNYDVLIDNNVPILFLAPASSPGRVMKWTTPASKMGFNVFLVKTKDGIHNDIAQYCFVNRIPDYMLGLSDQIGNVGHMKAPDYTAYKYNPKTGKYEKVELSSAQIKSIFRVENIESFDPRYYTTADRFNIVNEDLDAFHNFSDLKDLKDVNINLPNNLANAETIKNDVQFVISSMNAIRSQVKSSSFLKNVALPKFRSYSGIPGCIGEYIDKYYDYVGDLMDLVVEETDAITSLGQVMVDMDNDIAERGEALGTVKEIQRTPIQRIKTYKDRSDQKEEIPTNPTTEEDPGSDRPTGGGGGQSFEEHKYDIKDFLRYKREDGSLLLVKQNGNDISEVFYRYEYKSSSQAEYMRDKIQEKWKDVPYVSQIEADGKYVYIKFKTSAFENLTLKEIKEKYK